MKTLSENMRTGAQMLRSNWPELDAPAAFIQLGCGFNAEPLFDRKVGVCDMRDLPGFGSGDSPAGSPLTISLWEHEGNQVLVGQGHRYAYDGLGLDPVVLPVCVAHACGVRNLILIEPCISLKDALKVGGWFMPTDYINRLGGSPLWGNGDLVPHPFLDMVDAFSQTLNSALINALDTCGIMPRLGVVQCDPGPEFVTPAEARAAREAGAEVTTNGVVPETIVGCALGCRTAAILLSAGLAATYHRKGVSFADLTEAAEYFAKPLMKALRAAIAEIPATD